MDKSLFLRSPELSFLNKVTSYQEMVKELMDVLIQSLNEHKPQSIYIHQHCYAYHNFDAFYEFTSGDDPLSLYDSDFLNQTETELRKLMSRSLSSEDILQECIVYHSLFTAVSGEVSV